MPESAIATLAPVAGLDVTLSDGVLSVTIDRPDSLNSVTTQVLAGNGFPAAPHPQLHRPLNGAQR